MLQDDKFAALKREGIFLEFLMILRYFKPQKITSLAILIENWPKNHKIGGFGSKKSSNFVENSKIDIYAFVP